MYFQLLSPDPYVLDSSCDRGAGFWGCVRSQLAFVVFGLPLRPLGPQVFFQDHGKVLPFLRETESQALGQGFGVCLRGNEPAPRFLHLRPCSTLEFRNESSGTTRRLRSIFRAGESRPVAGSASGL